MPISGPVAAKADDAMSSRSGTTAIACRPLSRIAMAANSLLLKSSPCRLQRRPDVVPTTTKRALTYSQFGQVIGRGYHSVWRMVWRGEITTCPGLVRLIPTTEIERILRGEELSEAQKEINRNRIKQSRVRPRQKQRKK